MAESKGRPFLTNFRTYEAPLQTRVRLVVSNTWKKLRTRSDCCGHYGQPGC